MRLTKYILPIVLVLAFVNAKAQKPLISQYYLNNYVLNPALAGVSGDLSALAAYRQDYAGFSGAPQMQMLSFEMPFKNEKFGLGAYIHNSTFGPIRRTAFQAAYAYHIRTSSDIDISFGLGANVYNQSIDFLQLIDGNDALVIDPVLGSDVNNTTTFDASAGINFATDNFFTGFGANNLIQTAQNFNDDPDDGFDYNDRHFYWLSGFNIPIIDSVLDFEPSFLVKFEPAGFSPNADLNGRIIYKNLVWLGAAYRARNTVVGAFGVRIMDKVDIGYSYDHHLSTLSLLGGPSHEITLKFTNRARRVKPIKEEDTSLLAILIDSVEVDTISEAYDIAIAKADSSFDEAAWTDALSDYNVALGLKPEEAYPQTQIDSINAIIDAEELALAEKTEAEQAAEEALKLAEEEKARKDAEAEQLGEEEEAKRLAQEEEDKRLAEEQEAKRLAAEEAKRLAEEEVEEPTTTTVEGEKIEVYDESNRYNYVVAGSFGSFDNAKKFQKSLQDKGYEAEIIEHKSRGFYRVSLHKNIDSLSADAYKKKMRKELNNPGIWILEGQKYQKDAVKLKAKEEQEKKEAETQPVIKKTVEVQFKEEKGMKVEVLDANNKFYHVIAGSFGSIDNANKLKKEYDAKGYTAKILLDKDRNLYRVGLFSSLDASEARTELSKLQGALGSGLWLLKK